MLELEDVVVTTGDFFNIFHLSNHLDILKKLKEKHPLYIELTPIQTVLFDTLNKKALTASRELDIPLFFDYPVLYTEQGDDETFVVMRAIQSVRKDTVDSKFLHVPYSKDFFLDTKENILRKMVNTAKIIGMKKEEVQSAIKNQELITELAQYRFKKMDIALPKMSEDSFGKLVQECKKGFIERLNKVIYGYQPPKESLNVYKDRLKYELSVIKQLGFADYFLLIQDLINHAKSTGILVGAGRGSVGGSLVAFLMNITDTDPVRFNLMFERFINPERIDLPDIDMDFMSTRRHEVIEYVKAKYGEEYVSAISNFSTLGASSALRDVSRVHGLKPYEYSCSKLVETDDEDSSNSLEYSAEHSTELANFKKTYPQVWKHAIKLDGNNRNLGQHAAGVIVSSDKISNRAIVLQKEGAILPVTNWDKTMVEDFGLIKMDVLGLQTLDVIAEAKNYIKERHGVDINLMDIPLDDKKTLEAFAQAKTTGVFQFESPSAKKLLKDLGVVPLTFDSLVASTALNRPGPIESGLVEKYKKVYRGDASPEYPHELTKTALESTLGVMVYQEQIMQISRDLCGFTGAESDHLRKAIGKKDMEKMKEMREKFVSGAMVNDMTEEQANQLWEDIEKFASYGFCSAHATSYTQLSYVSMWLKVNYPCEFYASLLTVVPDDAKLQVIVADAQKNGIRVVPPDINVSSNCIEIMNETTLTAPFQAVKMISDNVANYILKIRQELGRPFTSFEDFEEQAKRIVGGKINSRHKDHLKRVGAFASIDGDKFGAMHESRLKDRLELMGGYTVEVVKADRAIDTSNHTKQELVKIIDEIRACDKCSLCDQNHAVPSIGKKPIFMMVTDTPSFKEAKVGKMMSSNDVNDVIKACFSKHGIDVNNGYYTSLVKAPKKKGEKTLSTEVISSCQEYLKREVELLNPPVILTLGANATRFFAPETKGSQADLVGRTVYLPAIKASVVFGTNPQSIIFNPSVIKQLETVALKLSELIE